MSIADVATLEEFLRLPEQTPRLEFFDGKVTPKLAAPETHAELFLIAQTVVDFVNAYAVPRRLARAFTGRRATFGGASLTPAAGVYRWENIPFQADGTIANDFTTPWDMVFEFDLAQPDIVERCRWFRANGAQVVLLADPDQFVVATFHEAPRFVTLLGNERFDVDAVLPGMSLTSDDIFRAIYPEGAWEPRS